MAVIRHVIVPVNPQPPFFTTKGLASNPARWDMVTIPPDIAPPRSMGAQAEMVNDDPVVKMVSTINWLSDRVDLPPKSKWFVVTDEIQDDMPVDNNSAQWTETAGTTFVPRRFVTVTVKDDPTLPLRASSSQWIDDRITQPARKTYGPILSPLDAPLIFATPFIFSDIASQKPFVIAPARVMIADDPKTYKANVDPAWSHAEPLPAPFVTAKLRRPYLDDPMLFVNPALAWPPWSHAEPLPAPFVVSKLRRPYLDDPKTYKANVDPAWSHAEPLSAPFVTAKLRRSYPDDPVTANISLTWARWSYIEPLPAPFVVAKLRRPYLDDPKTYKANTVPMWAHVEPLPAPFVVSKLRRPYLDDPKVYAANPSLPWARWSYLSPEVLLFAPPKWRRQITDEIHGLVKPAGRLVYLMVDAEQRTFVADADGRIYVADVDPRTES